MGPEDRIQIGSFLIRVDAASNVGVFDTRSKCVDAVGLTKDVRDRFGGGKVRVLDGISLSVRPNEFVGLLGPSGAWKIYAYGCDERHASGSGYVFVNDLELYRHLDSLNNRSAMFRRMTLFIAS